MFPGPRGPGKGLGNLWKSMGNGPFKAEKIWKILEILDDWDMRLNIDIP